MSVSLDTDSRAEAAQARSEAEAAAERARFLKEKWRFLLATEPAVAPRTPRARRKH